MEKDRKETEAKQAKLGCFGLRPCEYAAGPHCVYPGICKTDDNGKCLMNTNLKDKEMER